MIHSQDKSQYQNIQINLLQPGQSQPRKYFDKETLSTLADSIKSEGIIQPLVVRPIIMVTHLNHVKRYEIIAGERRWRAAQIANLESVPCLVRDFSDEQAAKIALIENMQREGLNPIDEGCC